MGVTGRLARVCSAHPRRTLAAWGVALIVAITLVVTALHGLTTNAHVVGTPESTRAADAIARAFPPTPRELRHLVSDIVVVRSERYTVDQSPFRAFVAHLAEEGRRTHKILAARTYYTSHDPRLVSHDRHATLLPLLIGSDSDAKPVVAAVQRANRAPDFAVSITGDHSIGNDFNTLSQQDLEHGELAFGLPAALVILLLVFGAVVAGLIPLTMGLLSIACALGLVAILTLGFQLSVFIVNMVVGMGLALGIDYSLFVISRYREERVHGVPKERAIELAGATASRAVLFSGTTLVVALLGMLIVPTTIMRSLAVGAILVGIVSVAAALTLLPALLGLLGDRVNAGRVPLVARQLGRADSAEGNFWRAVIARVLRRPVLSLALAAGVMLAAATPIFGLHIGASGVSTLPDRLPSKQGYLALQRDFPSSQPSPVQIVVERADFARQGIARLRSALASDPRFGSPTIQTSRGADVVLLTVSVRGDPLSSGAVSAVRNLRARVIPRAFAGLDAAVLVGGKTAENVDYFDAVTNPAPYVFAFVLGLSLVILTVAFRSLVIAVLSILLNLLSVGAAYGLLVLVFLHGVATHVLGFQHVKVIDAWVPLFLFSVLFALSMDYQVFILSRIKEQYDHSGSTIDAVTWGVASTARIITGAALIIVAVFSGFAAGDLVMFQQMGFGIAVSLLLDATLIRSIVLPASLKLLDRWSWYLPGWLDWLPRLEVERASI